jgi:ubiquinone/menaquinone biosynthesis C-methylase UbiE
MQKSEFLKGEGDAYFARNRGNYQAENDPLIGIVDDIDLIEKRALRVLEIGCGKGERLAHLKTCKGWVVHGLDPSQKAIGHARSINVDGVTGTADKLPWPDEEFDLVVFGFCLYLRDPSDLFTIAKECNRVLSSSGWIVIVDFFCKGFSYQFIQA